jgi:hypothetical protein
MACGCQTSGGFYQRPHTGHPRSVPVVLTQRQRLKPSLLTKSYEHVHRVPAKGRTRQSVNKHVLAYLLQLSVASTACAHGAVPHIRKLLVVTIEHHVQRRLGAKLNEPPPTQRMECFLEPSAQRTTGPGTLTLRER